MRRRDFLVESSRVALGLSVLPLVACSRGNQPTDRLQDGIPWKPLVADLEKQIAQMMTEAMVPGLSIAIINDGKLLWRRGFGVRNSATNEPVDNDTVFEAASTSKPVFAYAVMKLCEKGVMNLDTPLTHYTSERFLQGDPRLDLITARHVLTHTTGFPNWRSKEDPLQIAFTPGSQWAYSGEGISYLQSVVTHLMGGKVNPKECGKFEADVEVCGQEPSIDVFMQANLLVPFGMTSSGYFWSDAMEAHVARGHDEKGKPIGERKPSGATVARYGMAGGLFTTPTDYAKLLIEIVAPKPTDAFRLNQASRAEMLRPQVQRNPQSSWALGWQVHHTANGDFLRHGGNNPGSRAFVAASVERKTGYVIMTNGDNGWDGIIDKLMGGEILGRFLGSKLLGGTD